MAIDKFIPEVWSSKLLADLRKNQVAVANTNREYEGEIKAFGDTVKIHSFGDINIFPYTKNTPMTAPQILNDAELILAIDQQKAFNFFVDRIDQVQQIPKVLTPAIQKASYQLADVADKHVLGLGEANAGHNVTVAPNKVYEALIDAKLALDKSNTPKDGRFVIIAPEFEAELLLDARFVSFGTDATDNRLVNGAVGRAGGFTVFVSNNSYESATPANAIGIAGYNGAWAYAEQILDLSMYQPESMFGDAVKGLHVYGAKVLRPDSLVLLKK